MGKRKKHNKFAAAAKQAQHRLRRERSCEGKKAYPTREAAFQKNQNTYKCQFCGAWHRSGQQMQFVRRLQQTLKRTGDD